MPRTVLPFRMVGLCESYIHTLQRATSQYQDYARAVSGTQFRPIITEVSISIKTILGSVALLAVPAGTQNLPTKHSDCTNLDAKGTHLGRSACILEIPQLPCRYQTVHGIHSIPKNLPSTVVAFVHSHPSKSSVPSIVNSSFLRSCRVIEGRFGGWTYKYTKTPKVTRKARIKSGFFWLYYSTFWYAFAAHTRA